MLINDLSSMIGLFLPHRDEYIAFISVFLGRRLSLQNSLFLLL